MCRSSEECFELVFSRADFYAPDSGNLIIHAILEWQNRGWNGCLRLSALLDGAVA